MCRSNVAGWAMWNCARTPDIDQDEAVMCRACRRLMVLARELPSLGGLPELQTFRCLSCGVSESYEIEHSRSSARWDRPLGLG